MVPRLVRSPRFDAKGHRRPAESAIRLPADPVALFDKGEAWRQRHLGAAAQPPEPARHLGHPPGLLHTGNEPQHHRSEERRVGKEWVSPGRSRGSPDHIKKKKQQHTLSNYM